MNEKFLNEEGTVLQKKITWSVMGNKQLKLKRSVSLARFFDKWRDPL